MRRRIACLLTALCLMGCGISAGAETMKTVVTSFYPIHVFTRNLLLGVSGVTVSNLAAPEVGCLHDYQLTTLDMKTLAAADVFIVNGAGMESFLTDIAAQFGSLTQIVATDGVELIDEGNAHVWLSVKGAMAMAENIAKGLQAALPENAPQIALNLESYLARLSELDERLTAGLEPVKGREIVTFHEAFPYFAKAYGLSVAAVIEREPGEALTPMQLGMLIRQVTALGNPPLFIEPQYPDLAANTLAKETGAKVFTLDPIVTGPMDEAALTYYEDTMDKNMQVLLLALGQS